MWCQGNCVDTCRRIAVSLCWTRRVPSRVPCRNQLCQQIRVESPLPGAPGESRDLTMALSFCDLYCHMRLSDTTNRTAVNKSIGFGGLIPCHPSSAIQISSRLYSSSPFSTCTTIFACLLAAANMVSIFLEDVGRLWLSDSF